MWPLGAGELTLHWGHERARLAAELRTGPVPAATAADDARVAGAGRTLPLAEPDLGAAPIK
jgi:hypothetical protein